MVSTNDRNGKIAEIAIYIFAILCEFFASFA